MAETRHHTNWELRNAQNPVASEDRMYTWPVSRRRIPTHTSASHILLYSCAFFIRLVLRRYCFWRFVFLFEDSPIAFKAVIATSYFALWRCYKERTCGRKCRKELNINRCWRHVEGKMRLWFLFLDRRKTVAKTTPSRFSKCRDPQTVLIYDVEGRIRTTYSP